MTAGLRRFRHRRGRLLAWGFIRGRGSVREAGHVPCVEVVDDVGWKRASMDGAIQRVTSVSSWEPWMKVLRQGSAPGVRGASEPRMGSLRYLRR